MSKGYIRENMSSCGVYVLHLPKKYGTWSIYIHFHLINNIMIKYRHFICRLDDMLDELHDWCVFTKIDLKSEYHDIRMEKRWIKNFF